MIAARQELDIMGESFPRIYSSNSRFNDWINRSIADVQMMVVGNPEADYPYAGVPWFGTVFGRDGIITALQSLWLNPAMAKAVLECLAEKQADKVGCATEAEPGKILHEMRHGEMAALGEVPFGQYYGSVDATPLFIILARAYYERTADCQFIQRLWPNIERALRWIDEFGDCRWRRFCRIPPTVSQGAGAAGLEGLQRFHFSCRRLDCPGTNRSVRSARLRLRRETRCRLPLPFCCRVGQSGRAGS